MGKRKRNTKHVINCGQHKEKAKKETECSQCLVIQQIDKLPSTEFPRNEVLACLLTLNAENPN